MEGNDIFYYKKLPLGISKSFKTERKKTEIKIQTFT